MDFNNSKYYEVMILNLKNRPAGEMVVEGKKINYSAAVQIVALPIEETKKVFKYTIDPTCIDKIAALLEPVHWGCLAKIKLTNKMVTDLEIVSDPLADYYEDI